MIKYFFKNKMVYKRYTMLMVKKAQYHKDVTSFQINL